MPFKALSSVKKVAALAGEVRHIAELGPDGLIGALTTDPVTLAVNPVGTGTAKTAKIGLAEAHEFAFLSKLVAVVRANDDLWGVIDIAHTPKLDQSGHNFRALCASPSGESALGLSWDGRGAVLNLRKNEVIGRDFALRGDVRAAALAATECFVIVEGGTGGQYRVHAGPTPEAAPHVRADLPTEAKDLDRMRATPELAVVYKKGNDTACVVRRQANTASAKMVTFEQRALDFCVISSSLFVVGADGKLRLYNSDVLQKATGEVMTPTAVIDMRVDGEPSALGTSTSRGAATVWLGTKRGELIRVEAIKGGLALPA
ncbi:MAG: hypothetical protein IT373_21165 [Polyangiaceae bacterium]|nr:hypothetical protein [Polyangiaceae bacterium]